MARTNSAALQKLNAAAIGFSRFSNSATARRITACVFALATLLLLEDVTVSWIAGAPERAWGLLHVSAMRLATCTALAIAFGVPACVAWLGWPERRGVRLLTFALLLWATFLGNGRYIGSNDAAATRSLPFVIGREGKLCVEHSRQLALDPAALPYWFVQTNNHIVSRYPVATSLLALPMYLPAILGSYDPEHERVQELERMAAAALSVSGVLLIAAIAALWLDPFAARGVALLYAFGTSVATILSKALWQHAGGAFGFALALSGLLLSRTTLAQVLSIGLGAGIAVAARSTNAAPAACLLIAVACARGPRRALLSAAVAAVPLAAQLFYSRYYFGAWLGHGYGDEVSTGWNTPWGVGAAGLLLSPGRGLFIYSPCLAFAAVALWRGDSVLDRRTSRMLLAGIASSILIMGRWWCWWGGRSAGERMLSDVLPLWGVGLALAAKQFAGHPRWRTPFLISCAYACFVHTLISFTRMGPMTNHYFLNVMASPWHALAYAPLAYVADALGLKP